MGLLLILLAIVLELYNSHELYFNLRRWSNTTGDLLAIDFRKFLRAPTDSLRIKLEQLIFRRPTEKDIFEFLELEYENNIISCGFVEVHTQSFKKTPIKNLISKEKSLPDILTTSTDLLLPTEEELDNFRTLFKNYIDQNKAIGCQYLISNNDSSLVWLICPFKNQNSTKVLLFGLGFRRLDSLDNKIKNTMIKRFQMEPVWQWAVWPSENNYGIELVNSSGKSTLIIGDVNDKNLVRTFKLSKVDLMFLGWRINVWAKEFSPFTICFWGYITSLILGTILVLFPMRRSTKT